MLELLPGIDRIGKSRSFSQDLFGFPRSIPKVFPGYDPFDFLESILFPV